VNLCARCGHEGGPRSDPEPEPRDCGAADIDRVNPFGLKQLRIHEEAVKEDVETSLFHVRCLGGCGQTTYGFAIARFSNAICPAW
jgi:hypothetical protein